MELSSEDSFLLVNDQSDDDDVLSSAPFTIQPSAINSQAKCDLESYLKKVEENASNWSELISPSAQQDIPINVTSLEYETVYYQCPICMSSGFKTIQHIKTCATKNYISPKEVISLLRRCSKTTRPKNLARGIRRNNVAKNANKKEKKQTYELLLYDDEHRQQSIQKRVSKISIVNNRFTDNQFFHLNSLPMLWQFSHLTFDSNLYIVEGFDKYFITPT